MADRDVSEDVAAELRRRAEALWRRQALQSADLASANAASLLHELQVHQIELELQNAELRRAQEELAASRARYFDLFDLAPVGYLTLDPNGAIVEANLAAAELMGLERERLVGQPMIHFIARDDQEVYQLQQKRLAYSQQAEECELRLRRRNRSAVWVEMRSVFAEDRAGEQVCRVTLTDITERKQAEQLRFKANILESIGQAVIVLDLDMLVVYWNRYAEALYGWAAREVLGRGLHNLLMRQIPTEQADSIASSLIAGRSWSDDVQVNRKNGEVFSASFTVSPVRDPLDKLVGAIAVSRDVSQSRRIEEDLRLSREQLRGLSHRLMAGQESERQYVAHHLLEDESQGLAAVLIQLGMLGREAAGNPKLLGQILELEQLVDGLMRDLHGLAIYLRPTVLDHLGLQDAIAQYAEYLGQAHHLKVNSLFQDLKDARIPREVETALYRVVQEALSNVARHAHATEVSIVIQQREGSISAIVEDDGAGFAVDKVLREGRAGLVEMLERVEALGGHLYVESSPGQGTTVNAVVPKAPWVGRDDLTRQAA